VAYVFTEKTMKNTDPFIADIPAYAIGALDSGEIAALESHLLTCEVCQAELSTYAHLSEQLLLAVPPLQPSTKLRRKLQAHLPSTHKTSRPNFSWSFTQISVGFAMFVLLALSIFSIFQIQKLVQQQSKLTRQVETSQLALAAMSYPETQALPITAENISGTLLLAKEQNVAIIITWNLPVLQPNQTYQIWLIDPQGKRTSGGIFNSQPGLAYTSATVSSPGGLVNFNGIGVTIEPAGGSPQPTGQRIFKVDF
jgi:anti-sigma-K factor RskA